MTLALVDLHQRNLAYASELRTEIRDCETRLTRLRASAGKPPIPASVHRKIKEQEQVLIAAQARLKAVEGMTNV